MHVSTRDEEQTRIHYRPSHRYPHPSLLLQLLLNRHSLEDLVAAARREQTHGLSTQERCVEMTKPTFVRSGKLGIGEEADTPRACRDGCVRESIGHDCESMLVGIERNWLGSVVHTWHLEVKVSRVRRERAGHT